ELLFDAALDEDPEMIGQTFCHGSLVFRRDAYQRAGGYRMQFRAAQDVDLQFRLKELGETVIAPDALYAYRIDAKSISASSPIQKRLSRLAEAARDARRTGKDEAPILREASILSSEPQNRKRSEPGTGDYFIGRCLYARRDRRALSYLWSSIKA